MTKIVKSHWTADGDVMKMTMPLSKIDKENRLVSGFATLDNLDSQGDVVKSEASMLAFSRARGNIREQHDAHKAVGKMVNFREDEFFDPDTNKFYTGVYVTAYVSKGAQDTWEKVLDGTLSGFSIGGSINKYSNEINKDSGSSYRLIEDYDLTELSLVDNPANQLASVFSIQKSENGSVTVKGMIAETTIENVFYCSNDGQAQSRPEDTATCLECGSEMENIGWFEVADDRIGKVRDIVASFTKSDNQTDTDEGGVTMPEEEVKDEVVETEEVVETSEETEKVQEVVDDEELISKKIDDLREAVHNTLESSRQETNDAVTNLEKKIDEINESFEKKASELETKLDGIGEKLEAHKSKIVEFEKSLDLINKSSAFRKSADVESEEKTVNESKWKGAFSLDNL